MDAVLDLAFFSLLVKRGTLAAAAQELGITPPAVSKRLAQIESRLRVKLLNRTTRRMSLTPEGETYLTEGERIVADLVSHAGQDTGAGRLHAGDFCSLPQRGAEERCGAMVREVPHYRTEVAVFER